MNPLELTTVRKLKEGLKRSEAVVRSLQELRKSFDRESETYATISGDVKLYSRLARTYRKELNRRAFAAIMHQQDPAKAQPVDNRPLPNARVISDLLA